jgi:hypothetical protein
LTRLVRFFPGASPLRTAVLRPFVVLLALAILNGEGLAAQAGGYATVTGMVTNAATGQALSGALVTLTPLGGGADREATTSASGAFSYGLVAPGAYELRAESIGYRPVVARTLVVEGGDRGVVSLTLSAQPPPVLSVDTVALSGAASSRRRAGGTRFGAEELVGALPYRFDDLGSIVALSSEADASLGLQGLPGTLAGVIADGVPFYRAAHPLARAEQLGDPLFPRPGLSALTVQASPADVSLPGSASGYAALSTRAGSVDEGTLELGWSGGPLWSSDDLELPNDDQPALTSFQGSGGLSAILTPTTRLMVSAEALRQQTPLEPRIAEAVATSLSGLDPAVIDELSGSSVETFSRFGGAVRVDSRRDDGAQLFVRGSGAYTARGFDGPGPLAIGRASALPEKSVDLSLAAGWTAQAGDRWIYEIRGGVSGSERVFEVADPARPFAFLADAGNLLGDAAGAVESSRVDVVFHPSARWILEAGTVRWGLSGRLTRHAVTPTPTVQMLFSDATALVAGQGLAYAVDAPEAVFSTRELGAYAAFDMELRPGLSASVGARLDQEMIPGSEASLSTAWRQASGLSNAEYPSSFLQLGGAASLSWDPSLDGETMITASAALHHGDVDPAALAELFSQDGDATSTHFAGAGIVWPDGALPAGATAGTVLTLLGPDARPPRTVRGSLGLVRRLPGGWTVHADGAMRRTDFLLRRRDLNRPVVPQAQDPYGRNVYGTLAQDGTLVTATGSDAHRFTGFNEVWALDPDGWSEYWGVTAGIEYATGPTILYASYTRSATKDNWLGGSEGLVDRRLPPGLADDDDWADGTSDFDVPDRIVAAASTSVSMVTLSAVYRYRSGLPFTPRYRAGVDANGDGSFRNDVPFVDGAILGAIPDLPSCVTSQLDVFAERNSCRGPSAHALDVRLRFRLSQLGGRDVSLVVDGLNLVETEEGLVDDALLLVDPSGTISSSGGVVTIPVTGNADFGSLLYSTSRGRMLRVGLRIG